MNRSKLQRCGSLLAILTLTLALAETASAQPATPGRALTKSPRPPQGIRPLPPPVLMVRRHQRSVPLALTRVDVRTKIVGPLAETAMTLTFYNPNPRRAEGDLYFPLPEGSTVSGYALDVEGRMIDGVVVGKHEARQVFETEVRRGIDPGLVEWTRGRNFKTRIFPIPARGTRTVRVAYVSAVRQTRQGAVYQLPLGFRKPVKRFSLRVEVVKAAAQPVVLRGGPAGLRFSAWRDSYVAEAKLRNARLTKPLRVSLPHLERQPVRVERAPDGQVYFAIRDVVTPPATAVPTRPRRIAIYWDASLSRRKGAHRAQELRLLLRYLARLGRATVTAHLVVFRNEAERSRRFALPRQRGALIRAIRRVTYDGGTQIGAVKKLRGRVDQVLFFSDGLSNFGREDPPALGAPTYTINGATTTNHAFLRYLALRSGGAYLNLARLSVSQALSAIGAEALRFLKATSQGAQVEETYPRLRLPVTGPFTLAGRLTGATATVTLHYGVGHRETRRRTFTIRRADAVRGTLLRRHWAQQKLDDLLAFPERNEAAIAALGKAYSIVTPGTSLLVLERLSQYLEHGIRPPASWATMRARYDIAQKKRVLAKRREQRSKLAHVIALWQKRVAWYGKRFRYPRNFRYGKHRSPKRAAMGRGEASLGALRGGRGAGAGGSAGISLGGRGMAHADAKEKAPVRPRGPRISIRPWDPKTPYLRALKAAPAARRYAVYLAQRETHGSAPAFFLDCAHYFRRVGQRRLALRILSNLAELELENPALLRVLAHRLAQVNALDLSVATFEQVKALRPEEPQSYRDLALVLERRADRGRRRNRRSARTDYARALKLLSKVVMNRWQRFAEIEVIALTELNNILPKARRLGLRNVPVDRRLLKHLTLDVRIVMTWDADLTDMDLHVVEPSGEEAYFSHNRTTIGGMVSRDFTQGYGPEVYAVRRAMRGRYRIRTKYFGSSAAKLSGGVTLQVDVYTNYGRANQRRRSITLRLTKAKETFDVGVIRF